MRYSLSLFPLDAWGSLDEILAVVRHAETLGFHGVGLSEHLFTPVTGSERTPANPSRMWVDNFAFGAALASATERIRIMLSALIVPYRHPLDSARGVATLDWISGGRLDVTTGVGWLRAEFDALGVPFERRGALTDEYLRAMIALWTEEYPEFHGETVSFRDLVTGPPCVQRPHVPLLIGGTGARAFRRVVEFGAGWAPMLAPAEVVRDGLARIRELAAAAGRDLSDLRVFTRIPLLGGNPATSRAAAGHGHEVTAQPPPSGPEEARDLIGRHVAAGVTEVGLSFPWRDAAEFTDRIEWVATELMQRAPCILHP